MPSDPAPQLPLEQLEENFADINPPLSAAQALEEGSRCLFCHDAPCIKACPTEIDVPQFIRQIMTGNLRGSARTILSANILGQSCARVCPTSVLCEGACVLNAQGRKPVEIGRLQRYAVDPVIAAGTKLFKAGAPNGKRVALIGAGPASLACAAELRQRGYETVIFDANPQPGGLDTYGIAAYKMRAADVIQEIEMVRALGVEIRNGVAVGREISLAQLEADFSAIFIGIGLGATDDLGIPGEELPGCLDALTFIEQTKSQRFDQVGVARRVAVAGGGNTAIDVVTAARRLGAEEVFMVYRRSQQEMSAFDYEYELAKKDCVTFVWQALPVRVLGNGHVEGIECVRTQPGPKDGKGRRSFVPVPGSEFRLDVSMFIKALGQKRNTGFLQQIARLELKNGCVVVSETMQTGNPRYFAGGDCVNGGGEVVDAVAHGKRAALGIDQMLGGRGKANHA
ncbi:MAG TPA: NAD(P)-dependent oxidoreductase [Candidatus Saccharimonadales bacterium]|jgi:dihydropyrimidine dehydrogenase (NAD+) subunit PreT|nr:NAD(P)-dependent oxidoreductase [Candidatus Saccharimonadales bacterium]